LQLVRPLNLGETLDASAKILCARWRTLATVMLAVAVPVQLLGLLIVSATTDVYEVGSGWSSDGASSATTYSDEGAYVAGQVAIQLLAVLSYLIATVACYRAVADHHLGRPTSAAESLRFTARRSGTTLWLTIVLVVGLLTAFILLVIPGIWLGVAWAVAIPVMLVEGRGGVGALKRSFELVQGRWWATFGRLAVAYIMVIAVAAVAMFALLLPAIALVDATSFGALVLEHVANVIVSLVTTPFIAAVTTLVYFDLRVRKEGFDVAQLAGETGVLPAARPPAAPLFGGWAPPVAPEPDQPS
jgi:Membrane domain of glycerophosphoryl diester phosphodiesterase